MSEQNEPFNSVQPSNRTIIEESLEYAWVKVLENLESPYPNLKNPLLCPDEFVSLLASERGVQDWQPGDTLEQQRSTTDKAFEIHSKAGTRYGLRTSIDALGFNSQVTKGALAYSLDVSAEIEKGELSEKLQTRLSSRVNTYKSERDTVSLELARSAFVTPFIGVFAETGVLSDSAPYTFQDSEGYVTPKLGVFPETYVLNDSQAAT
ncbi:phage tail protein I [Vibrio sp. Isolate24]|uniref:phage tail protein I n=1 Tax=Vibrio sp. Isolate24 TaxID=2908534 RepID=UPI001EFD6690|nr:phage tail protein I [Vibrio sp. Isolate24]MCG9678750.1 phage tail protein I [Vibrio sp. Isolate24]